MAKDQARCREEIHRRTDSFGSAFRLFSVDGGRRSSNRMPRTRPRKKTVNRPFDPIGRRSRADDGSAYPGQQRTGGAIDGYTSLARRQPLRTIEFTYFFLHAGMKIQVLFKIDDEAEAFAQKFGGSLLDTAWAADLRITTG